MMVTTSKDILETLGTDEAPDHWLVALGYAGWSAGQLEQELVDGAWLVIPPIPSWSSIPPSTCAGSKPQRALGSTPAPLQPGWAIADTPALPHEQGEAGRRLPLHLSIHFGGDPMSSRSIMGFDYGTKSIGVAIGQELTGSARPFAPQGERRHPQLGRDREADQASGNRSADRRSAAQHGWHGPRDHGAGPQIRQSPAWPFRQAGGNSRMSDSPPRMPAPACLNVAATRALDKGSVDGVSAQLIVEA